MKKEIKRIIELPSGAEFSFKDDLITLKASGKEIKRKFLENDRIAVKKEGNNVEITSSKATKRELKLINTMTSHLKNMVEGIKQDYIYQLEICNVHFPMTTKVEGNNFKIKNFLGERIDRIATILPNVKVDVKATTITISSPDLEAAGQTAANFEIATKIRNRDRRIFQDGIFITSKPGWKK